MRGRSQSSISYAEGRHGASDRFQVIAPDFQAMFSSSPSDLKNLRSASSSSRKRLGDEADRFEVTYLLLAPCEAAAREKVLEICLEQTVELPASLVPEGTWIREHVVGRLESLTKPKDRTARPSSGRVERDCQLPRRHCGWGVNTACERHLRQHEHEGERDGRRYRTTSHHAARVPWATIRRSRSSSFAPRTRRASGDDGTQTNGIV